VVEFRAFWVYPAWAQEASDQVALSSEVRAFSVTDAFAGKALVFQPSEDHLDFLPTPESSLRPEIVPGETNEGTIVLLHQLPEID
jgi:hypothetical protein